jgi:antitoxin component of MazEF toxin-antitoxin module
MRVSRWRNGLAVRLPRDRVERLGLHACDALTVFAAGEGRVALARDDRRADALVRMDRRAPGLPEGWRLGRDGADARDDREPGRGWSRRRRPFSTPRS